jgi:glyoxylase I family protein
VNRFRTPEVILFSSDVQRTADFYIRLGFSESFRVPDDGDPIHVDLELDGYRIGFASITSSRAAHGLDPAIEGQRGTITLWTDDVESSYAELTRRGVPGIRKPHRWLGELLIAWVEDPDGHPIQLVQRLN